jgi:predicted PurR-regulated permease PerM
MAINELFDLIPYAGAALAFLLVVLILRFTWRPYS